MYPAHFFNLFPAFPRDNRVFVAMNFDAAFTPRWKDVIEPGIEDAGLKAFRTDVPKISDSILTEILKNIGQSQLILVDLTALKGIRNGNVMYELGLAQATRQPQEVVIFRSDTDPLLFDIANVRVNKYDPDNEPAAAKRMVKEAVIEAIQEINQLKSLAVERVSSSLDQSCFLLLMSAAQEKVHFPLSNTIGQHVSNFGKSLAFTRLLEMGLLKADYYLPPEFKQRAIEVNLKDLVTCTITPLGRAVVEALVRQIKAARTKG